MISFALYGRVGQGVRTASRILARSAFYSGQQVQCLIPYATDVQTGFVKLDKLPISSRALAEPDFFIMFDKKIDAGLKHAKPGSVIIVNSDEKPKIRTKNKTKVFYINTTGAAARRQKPNIVMIGALAKVYGKLPMKHIKAAVEEEGISAADLEEGFRSVRR